MQKICHWKYATWNPFGICRVLTGLYSAYLSYICNPNFADESKLLLVQCRLSTGRHPSHDKLELERLPRALREVGPTPSAQKHSNTQTTYYPAQIAILHSYLQSTQPISVEETATAWGDGCYDTRTQQEDAASLDQQPVQTRWNVAASGA